MITFVFVFLILESQPIILATDINTIVVLILGYKLPSAKGMAGILEISYCILLVVLVPVCPFQSTVNMPDISVLIFFLQVKCSDSHH